MLLGSFYFKLKGREALKGNWQTAMVVSFFSGILLTATQVLMTRYMPVYAYTVNGELMLAVGEVSRAVWLILIAINALSVLVTPTLSLGCNHYFVMRLKQTELGAAALWSRFSIFLRALWLYLYMGLRIFLWGLLLVVPGVLAAIRYSMAPYFMAENPEMTATEAIEKSKSVMQGQKMSYFSLRISFFGWGILSYFVQILLMPMSGILATVAGLFIQVWLGAYVNASVASFYLTMTEEGAASAAKREIRQRMQEMGVDTSAWDELERQPDANGMDDALEASENSAETDNSAEPDDGTDVDAENDCTYGDAPNDGTDSDTANDDGKP